MLQDPADVDDALANSEISGDAETQRAVERYLEANEAFRATASQLQEPVRVAYEGSARTDVVAVFVGPSVAAARSGRGSERLARSAPGRREPFLIGYDRCHTGSDVAGLPPQHSDMLVPLASKQIMNR